MADALYILLTLLCFGAAHLYVTACDKLKAKPKHD